MVQYKESLQKLGQMCFQIVYGYANGRFAEIQGLGKIKYQLVCNAENFIEKAKNYGLKVVNYPTLGGIMVWQKGNTLSSGDGVGHVAIVERIDSKNQIYTSESAYGSTAFYNSTRTNNNGRWGMSSAYKFRGCIVNPAIGDVHYEDDKHTKFVKDVQKAIGAKVDGIAGNETLSKVPTLSKKINSKNKVVKILQEYLISLGFAMPRYGADGDFGNETEKAVKEYQKSKGLIADGIVGKNTWRKLLT